jgi:S-disulfanyl-L-cysteine oxidoreductase SoxD
MAMRSRLLGGVIAVALTSIGEPSTVAGRTVPPSRQMMPSTHQSPASGIGRPPTADELRRLDIAVMPDGRGLPRGSGTAAAGRDIYAAKCASCHGATGKEGPNDPLTGGQGSLATRRPLKTVGSFWPFATTLWDYINRAMPYEQPGSLAADEVYAVTAYILHLNGIVGEREVLSESTLAGVKMPNRDGFVREDR